MAKVTLKSNANETLRYDRSDFSQKSNADEVLKVQSSKI